MAASGPELGKCHPSRTREGAIRAQASAFSAGVFEDYIERPIRSGDRGPSSMLLDLDAPFSRFAPGRQAGRLSSGDAMSVVYGYLIRTSSAARARRASVTRN